MKSESIKKALDIAISENNPKEVTVLRGRLINEYKKEIETLLKDQDISPEEKARLVELKEALQEEIEKHKIQLSARYNKEFINKKSKIGTIFTAIPNAISIAINKVKTCIGDIKNAKDKKEKTEKTIDALKSIGLLAATPFIGIGKFVLDQWYLVAGIGGAIYLFKNPDKILPLGNKALEILGITGDDLNVAGDFIGIGK